MSEKIYYKYLPLPKKSKPAFSAGFSLIELITVLAGLVLLTSIASITFKNIFSDLENDEVQAHLNSIAADCLKITAKMADSKEDMISITSKDDNPPASVDVAMLDKNNYAPNENHNTCNYFQIDPKNSDSKTHFSMGFGIANGKVTKWPPSIGQVFGIGSLVKSKSIFTRWHFPFHFFQGGIASASLAKGNAFHGFFMNSPISGLFA